MLVGSTTTSVCHTHRQGQAPHAHGFGLLGEPRSSDTGRHPDDASHTHLIVLGIEFYCGETPLPEDSSSPVRNGPAELKLGLCVAAEKAPVPDDGIWQATFTPPAPAVTGQFLAPVPRVPEPPRLLVRCSLSDRARGERSGVSLI